MALTVQRDEEALRTGLERWHPSASWSVLIRISCETLVVDGDLVVRLPPLTDGMAWCRAERPTSGFGTRAEAIGRLEAGLGRTLEDLGWYEIFALVRAAAIATRIAVLHEKAGCRSMLKVGHDPSLAAALDRIS